MAQVLTELESQSKGKEVVPVQYRVPRVRSKLEDYQVGRSEQEQFHRRRVSAPAESSVGTTACGGWVGPAHSDLSEFVVRLKKLPEESVWTTQGPSFCL